MYRKGQEILVRGKLILTCTRTKRERYISTHPWMIKAKVAIPLFESHISIKRKQIRVTNLNRGKHINYKRKTTGKKQKH